MAGRSIKDHSFWAGGASKQSPLPDGVKTKSESSATGAGELGKYEDTTEAIKAQQTAGVAKAKGHPMKPGTRN